MRVDRGRATSLALAVLMLAGGASIASADGGQDVQACALRADTPNLANDATVGREGCVTIAVDSVGYIKEDRSGFPDDIVGDATFDAGTQKIFGSCGNGRGAYYSQFNSSSGATAQSSRVTRC